jgi:DNA-binding NtrC family response regulator
MTHPTPELQRLIATEPDLVDRIFDYILSDPALAEAMQRVSQSAPGPAGMAKLKTAVRAEFAGETVRIAKRPGNVHLQVLALFNGRNATEVARRLGISRATVYRVIKQPGTSRPASTAAS